MKQLLPFLFLFAWPAVAEVGAWGQDIPAAVATASLLPDTVLDEEPCDWRAILTPIVAPLVRDCASAREAVLKISTQLGKATGVYYSTQRRKHNMNVLEALAEKKVSCTGQSILLVCALRAVGIPARAAGILTWNHLQGNHTWAEAWFDGQWHMIELNESDFNTPWVMENIGMLDARIPLQRIKAATPQGVDTWYPADLPFPAMKAEDVTERYLQLAKEWYARHGHPAEHQRLLVDLQPRSNSPLQVMIVNESGTVLSSAQLPLSTDDVRYMTRLSLPRQGKYHLQISGSDSRIPLECTPAPVQVLRLSY